MCPQSSISEIHYEASDNESDPFKGSSSDEYNIPDTDVNNNESDSDEVAKTSRKRCRWKKSNPDAWKRNIIKRQRSSGIPYKTKKGTNMVKAPKVIDCSRCKYKCTINLDEDFRKKVCSEFWNMDYNRQKDFILSQVSNGVPKCHRIRTGTGVRKENSRVYRFKKQDVYIRVCKSYFTKTLCISHGPIDRAFAGKNEIGIFATNDQRGRKESSNKTSPELVQKVMCHIEKFPTVESHYCRKTTKRQYLDSKLSIAKMFQLYLEECRENNFPAVSSATYRRIFCENYNLSFFKPKKDLCMICWNREHNKNKAVTDDEFKAHIKRGKDAKVAKDNDKLRATNDQTFVSATFDLQSVLQIPSSDVSQMYYSKKLCAYNLTIYEAAPPRNAHCYAWTEINGQRGSSEIGTCLLKWIESLPRNVSEISLYSDTCSGQNRNQYIAAMFMYVVSTYQLQVIQHNFLESGHSYMEADSMHSAIEHAKKYVPVYTMNDWLNIFRMARSRRVRNKVGKKYEVHQLRYNDFKDLRSLAGQFLRNRTLDRDGNRVNWLKIKVLRYEKNRPDCIMFKYNYTDEEFKVIEVFGRGRSLKIPTEISGLYKNVLPISEDKKKHLLKLCNSNAIPEEYHEWYKSLPTDKKKGNRDIAPEPSIESESDEDNE